MALRTNLVLLLLSIVLVISSCDNSPKPAQEVSAPSISYPLEIIELDDNFYPDNPDIGFRSENYATDFFKGGIIQPNEKGYDFHFISTEKYADTLKLENINLMEYIPSIPEKVKDDEYLSYISVVNQEWNRNQVKFVKGEFYTDQENVVRLDMARNCLNAYLWEIIVYTMEGEKELPIYHGWFNFPKDLYAQLFEKKNSIPFSKYADALENWVDPDSKRINRDLLRKVDHEISVSFSDNSDAMYPLEGARKKKFKEIIYPTSFASMRDLQNDSTLLATFTPPGFYNRADPRTTELGRFFRLDNLMVSALESGSNPLLEIELQFTHRDGKKQTKLVFGGLDTALVPTLPVEKANSGWKNSMGVGNHPFYETYEQHEKWQCSQSPYYAFLTDVDDKWLDSHKIGIDGPILHFDGENQNILHLWLLSFERHALVGHYVINLPAA